MLNWDYEREEREMLFSLAKDGDTFFDIGANEGLYSIAFAKQFPKSKVCAFEPIRDTRLELIENIDSYSLLDNVIIFPCGLSDYFGKAIFYFSPSNSGATSLSPLDEKFGPTITMEGLVSTIDRVCVYHSPLDIIKCDVEGAELLVFKGGSKSLEKHKPTIQCEMLRKWTKRFGYHPNDIIAFLGQYDYHCFTLRDGKLERFETMTDDTVETNFYFIHPEREAWKMCSLQAAQDSSAHI